MADFEYEAIEASYEELKEMKGELYVKLVSDFTIKPFKITREIFDPNKNDGRFRWFVDDYQVKNFYVFGDVMIFEDEEALHFVPYVYDGNTISSNLGIGELLELEKKDRKVTKLLFHEADRAFYVLQLQEWSVSEEKTLMLPRIYKFDPKTYTIKEVINPFDLAYKKKYEDRKLDKRVIFEDYITEKNSIIGDGQLLREKLETEY